MEDGQAPIFFSCCDHLDHAPVLVESHCHHEVLLWCDPKNIVDGIASGTTNVVFSKLRMPLGYALMDTDSHHAHHRLANRIV